MKDRPTPDTAMTTEQALAVLTAEVELDEHPSGPSCGICGVPMRTWWSSAQAARHQRYHRALASLLTELVGAPS